MRIFRSNCTNQLVIDTIVKISIWIKMITKVITKSDKNNNSLLMRNQSCTPHHNCQNQGQGILTRRKLTKRGVFHEVLAEWVSWWVPNSQTEIMLARDWPPARRRVVRYGGPYRYLTGPPIPHVIHACWPEGSNKLRIDKIDNNE